MRNKKVGSARRVTCLAGQPFCDGRVTRLAEATFSRAKGLPLGLLSVSGETAHLPLPLANINTYLSLGAKCWLREGVGGQLPRNPLLISFGSAGRGDPFTRGRCSSHKRGLSFSCYCNFSCFSICRDYMNLAEFLPSFLSFDFSHFCEMNIFEGTPCSLYV